MPRFKILVRKEFVGATVDQWCAIVGIDGDQLWVKLLGTGEYKTVPNTSIIQFNLDEQLDFFVHATTKRIHE